MKSTVSGMLFQEEAFRLAHRNREGSRWPAKAPNNRLQPYYRPVLKPRFSLPPGAKIFTIGSCFARNVEEHLGRLGFLVPMLSLSVPNHEYDGRPAGILNKFTPPGALQEIERTFEMLQDPKKTDSIIDSLLLPVGDGMVIDLELRGFVPVTWERARERRRQIFGLFAQAFESDCVVITLGLVECWIDVTTGRAIQETPAAAPLRRLKQRFGLKILQIDEVIAALDRMIRLLLSHGKPNARILLTVSPVPLEATFSGMDIVIANAYAKATLRTAAQVMCDRFPQADYFPAYEMVTMSRGDDVWESDLIHVTDKFVGYVVERLTEDYVQIALSDIGETKPDFVTEVGPPFRAEGACGWIAPLPQELEDLCDDEQHHARSSLVVFEDATELGPGHEQHATIRLVGGGCYSFWKGALYFSSSDGGNPNTNGRTYAVYRVRAE